MVSTIAYPFTAGVGSLLGCDTDSNELAWLTRLRLLAVLEGIAQRKLITAVVLLLP